MSKAILAKANAQYRETSNKITILLTDLKNPEKATQMVSEKFFSIKRLIVKTTRKGIEIIIDKKHYYDNLQKFIQFVISSIG